MTLMTQPTCGRKITLEEIKQAIHKLDLISKPYELYANPSDATMVKDLIPNNVKLVEVPYVEEGKIYLMDRKAFEEGLVYGDFKLFDELMVSINNYRNKQSESEG